jgi:hypothetical protein
MFARRSLFLDVIFQKLPTREGSSQAMHPPWAKMPFTQLWALNVVANSPPGAQNCGSDRSARFCLVAIIS